DSTQDMPVELLHTILLGLTKYVWFMTHSKWKDLQKSAFSVRLQDTDVHGLSVPAIQANYIMQYANLLIRRKLKTLAQIGAFHVYDQAYHLLFKLWKASGELSALLWYPEIRDMDAYIVSKHLASLHCHALIHTVIIIRLM
ncbi:hypothetical protein CERSUDRAFT_58613, partial [Gelatoporia subvermispora B]